MSYPKECKDDLQAFFSIYRNQLGVGLDAIDPEYLENIVNILEKAIKSEKTIFTCGNGGSSSIADHFVCDFLKGTSTNSTVQPIIYSLASSTPTITAIANDISYDDIFSYQLSKYGSSGDILLSVSSSGNSPNIIKAIENAENQNITTISFVGFDGGDAKTKSDYCIHIPVNNYGVVEDIHHSLMHMLAQYIRLRNLEYDCDEENVVF